MNNLNKILHTLSYASSDTRDDTIISVLTTALSQVDAPITKEELIQAIEISYGVTLYDSELAKNLAKLVEAGVIEKERDKFALSNEEKGKIKSFEAKERSNDTIRYQNFKNFVKENIANIEGAKVTRLWHVYIEYLYECFFVYGTRARDFFHPNTDNAGKKERANGSIMGTALSKLEDEDLKKIFPKVINSYPDYATIEDINFINDLAQKTLAFTSLGLDPKDLGENIEKELIDWVIYVDTNFLFSVLDLHYHPENEASKELLKLILTNKEVIKIEFRYLELTLKELRQKKRDFENLDSSLTKSAIKALLRSDDIDDFTRNYYMDLLRNPDALHPGQKIDLAEFTLPKEGIKISRNKKQLEILNEEFVGKKIEEFSRYIDGQNELRQEFSAKSNSFLKPYYKSETQLKHDVTLREFILMSRGTFKNGEDVTFNSVKYYGITLDELLIKYDYSVARHSVSTTYPTFFRPSFLLNQLVKILPVKTDNYKKAFIKAISSRGYNKDVRTSANVLQIVSYLKDRGIDNEEVLFDIISRRLFLDNYKEASVNDNFDKGVFIESEINRIINEREEKLKETEKKLEELNALTKQQNIEKQELQKEKDAKVEAVETYKHDVEVYKKVVDKLTKKFEKLEGRSGLGIPQLAFEPSPLEVENNDLKKKLAEEKEKNRNSNIAENERRKQLRKAYLKSAIRKWRVNSFLYMIIGPIIVGLVIIYIWYVNDWDLSKVDAFIRDLTANSVVALVVGFVGSGYSIVLGGMFADCFRQSSINAFSNNVEYPKELLNIPDEY